MSYYPEHANIGWNTANKRLGSKSAPKHQRYEEALRQIREMVEGSESEPDDVLAAIGRVAREVLTAGKR